MPQLMFKLTAKETTGALSDLVKIDAEIDALETDLSAAKESVKELRADLKDALGRRACLSAKIRAGEYSLDDKDDGGDGDGEQDANASEADPSGTTSVTFTGAAIGKIGEAAKRLRGQATG